MCRLVVRGRVSFFSVSTTSRTDRTWCEQILQRTDKRLNFISCGGHTFLKLCGRHLQQFASLIPPSIAGSDYHERENSARRDGREGEKERDRRDLCEECEGHQRYRLIGPWSSSAAMDDAIQEFYTRLGSGPRHNVTLILSPGIMRSKNFNKSE